MKMPTELQDTITQGLKNLVALRLPGQPSSDTIAATAQAWIMALQAKPVAWDADMDGLRIKQTFVRLMGSTEKWPSPALFYEMLASNPRAPQKMLNPPTSNNMSPKTRAMVDGLLSKLRRHASAEQ